ncbi:MAG: helix-turn-helix transcriptional regulator [Gammaproteobacteria bacterium]|nr:helix-turn-helix transcriptional regulator [Gammaproteobacteria bacterium]
MPDPQITLLSVLFLIGAAQGLFFALTLFSSTLTDRAASRYLAFLLLLFSLELLNEFLDRSQFGLKYFRLMILIYPVNFLYGPLVWLYTSKMCSSPSTEKSTSNYLHFIPTLIFVAVVWQLLFQPLTDDVNFFVDNPTLLQPNQIQPWITPPYTQELAILHITAYLFASLWLLHRHSLVIAEVFSYREGVALSWLRRLLLALVTLLGLFAVRELIAEWFDFVDIADVALNFGFFIVIYALAYFAGRQPRIFTQRISHQATRPTSPGIESTSSDQDGKVANSDNDLDDTTGKYKKSALDSNMSARILNRLTETMQQEKPYLKSNLTLPDLAKLVSTSPNYLSQVINEQLRMNFFDFINSYRIETAKDLIVNPLPHTRTILDIAMESAFNSKSAFYTAFKKQMGITPAEFKKSQSQ